MTDPQALRTELRFAGAPPTGSQLESWRTVVAEMTAEIPDPGRVEVILTDRFARFAGEYLVRSVHRSNPDMTAADYQAQRVDGASAVAITIELPDNRQAIVASAGLLSEPGGVLRHAMLHEAQHVRMIQHGDPGYAVHRRVSSSTPFRLPDGGLAWEYVWMAGSSIDEFRAERAMHERGWTVSATCVTPGDFAHIVDAFGRASMVFRTSRDVRQAYQQSMAALDRYAMYLAYAAAGIVTGAFTTRDWREVPALTPFVDLLRDVPSPDTVVPAERLLPVALEQACLLQAGLKDRGFDYHQLPNDQGTYLTVL